MGLDMFLRKKNRIGNAKIKVEIIKNEYEWYKNENTTLELDNATCIVQEIGYWRKANQIHKWFVDNVQLGNDNCGEYYVSEENLKALLDICKEIKEKCPLIPGKVCTGTKIVNDKWVKNYEDGKIMSNIEIAEKLLPRESGFFFGSLDYDEYYMQDIENTISIIEEALKDKDGDIYYTSSW